VGAPQPGTNGSLDEEGYHSNDSGTRDFLSTANPIFGDIFEKLFQSSKLESFLFIELWQK